MKKRLNIIFFLTILTFSGLVICELYWVYINYRHARSNFFDTSSLALQKSVDRYYLGLNQLPISLKDVRKPTLTYLLTDFLDSTAKREKKTKLAKKTRLSFQSVSIEKPNLQDFKGLMARLISQSKNQQLNLDTLDLIFHHELARRGISERFTLSLQKMNNHLDSWEISTIIHFSNGAKRITGTLEDRSAYFLRTNLGPGLVSIALIMMSLGSLFYMNYILRRHIQLDIMKTSFTNNIIHELRTPLSILRSTNEALADFGAAKDEQSLMRYLGINKVVIEDLNNNIERILEISRSEQGKRKPQLESVNLTQLAVQAITRFSEVYGARIVLNSNEKPFEVFSDKFMLEVIFSNLIENAIKYSRAKAEISIDLHHNSSSWSMSVTDKGMGIPSAELPYIFEKFYRVPVGDVHDIKGYGIGLYYVKQIVDMLQGEIKVKSKVNEGTNFKINFKI